MNGMAAISAMPDGDKCPGACPVPRPRDASRRVTRTYHTHLRRAVRARHACMRPHMGIHAEYMHAPRFHACAARRHGAHRDKLGYMRWQAAGRLRCFLHLLLLRSSVLSRGAVAEDAYFLARVSARAVSFGA